MRAENAGRFTRLPLRLWRFLCLLVCMGVGGIAIGFLAAVYGIPELLREMWLEAGEA